MSRDLMGSVGQSEHAIDGRGFDHFHVLEYTANVAKYPAVRRQMEIKIHVIVFDVEASYLPTGSGALIVSGLLEIRLHIPDINVAVRSAGSMAVWCSETWRFCVRTLPAPNPPLGGVTAHETGELLFRM
jgi:hypothetical protein